MQSVVYKPFKKNVSDWILQETYQKGEREIASVGIGKRLTVDEETGTVLKEEIVSENIYKHVMQGIFKNDDRLYETYVTLGCEPGMVISYDGRLNPHNDKIEGYISFIQKLLEVEDPALISSALVGFLKNEITGEKYNDSIRELTNRINKQQNTKFPIELIGLVLKEYCCETKREYGPIDDVVHYMPASELFEQAGELLSNKLSGIVNEELEKAVYEELFYRFLEGTLRERR